MNVKKKFNILKEVNKVYKEQNPSLFLKKIDNKKKLKKLLISRKKLLLKLKLHPKIFKNSKNVYEVNIWFTNSRHLKFEKFHKEEDALAEAKYLARTLSLSVWNASDPKNGHYLD